MSTQTFDLLHATGNPAAEHIQREGFRLSETGFFGPAVYFYENTPLGFALAKKWILKKVSWREIPIPRDGVILEVAACCDDKLYVDATEGELLAEMEARADRAKKNAWRLVDERHPDWERPKKQEFVDKRTNRARNYVIMLAQRDLPNPINILKGQIEKGHSCFVVRVLECLSPPPYTTKTVYWYGSETAEAGV